MKLSLRALSRGFIPSTVSSVLSLTLPFGLALGLLTAPGCLLDGEDPAPAVDATSGQDTSPSDVAAADTPGPGAMDVATDLAAAPPIAGTAAEGTQVIPQTVLHLSAEAQASLGADVAYEWTVEQPAGSVSVFMPSSSAPDPTFEVNVAGTYTFHVQALDATGAVLASSQPILVQVVPDLGIHVELTWDTPADPDQTDEGPNAGADLDLHFLRPNTDTGTFVGSPGAPDEDGDGQPDPYFDTLWDTYWFNANPDWSAGDPATNHDPSLDRDDTDGAGPENLNLANPEHGDYLLAVHSWDDHGFGDSVATVRVYINGQLAWESPPTTLHQHDLWKVGTLAWPSGAVTPAVASDPTGGAAIMSDYSGPLGQQ